MIRIATDEYEIKLDEDFVAQAIADASPRSKRIIILELFEDEGCCSEVSELMFKEMKKMAKDYKSAALNCGNPDDADFYLEEADRCKLIAEAWKNLWRKHMDINHDREGNK